MLTLGERGVKAAVVGANGFLGSAIVRELRKDGVDVVLVDRHASSRSADEAFFSADVSNVDALKQAFAGVDVIYHLAAVLGTSELETGVRPAIETNILGTLNVLEAAVACGVQRIFVASKPSVWLNTYTITKHCSEQLCRQFANYNPVNVYIFRYLNIYGPKQKLQPVRKILPIFAAQALRGLPLQIYGDGLQTVDMLFVDDAARMTVDFTKVDPVGQAIDCGTGVEMTVLEVAEAVNTYYGNRAGIEHIPMRKGETPRTRLVADTTELDRLLPGRKLTDWSVALATSLDWYAAQPAAAIDAALAFYGIKPRYSVAW